MKLLKSLGLLAFMLSCGLAQAEVPSMSPDVLKSESSHIVIGKIRAVYSSTEKSKKWENTNSVAEISVISVEKGADLHTGNVIYAHYWNQKWIGKGDQEPHSGGHDGVSKGETVRAHLERKDGNFHVLLPNGFVTLKPNKAKEASVKSDDEELTKVQGKWGRTVETGTGTIKIVKEHKGNKTTLTVMDSAGQVVEKKKSDFRVENTGKIRIFTYFNNAFTAGPNKGRADDAPQSYIYRVTGDTFVEVRGLLVGDDERRSAFTWERLKE